MDKRRKTQNCELPPAALPYLRKAGWTPKRVVPTSVYELAYESEGITFLPKTKLFLRRFGGLIIRYATSSGRDDVLEFLAERAVQGHGR